MAEKIPDPNFKHPSAWSITTNAGSASVTGGKLVCTGWRGSVTCDAAFPIVGLDYRYQVKVSTFTGGGLALVQYGGTIPTIWAGAYGTGVFTGEFTATDASFGVNIAVAFTPSDLVVDRLSIMSSAEVEIHAALTSYAGLQALIANADSPATYRLYRLFLPQDPTLPAVVYQRIVGNRVVTMSDSGGTGVERVVVQFTAWASTVDDADEVMEQVRLALKAASFEVVPLNNRSLYEPQTRLSGMEFDFAIWHR